MAEPSHPPSVSPTMHTEPSVDDLIQDAHREPFPGPDRKTDEYDPYVVRFEPGDPANPKNWSSGMRWYITLATGILVLNATFASAAPTGIIQQLMDTFHLRDEVAILCISLFVLAYCVGPLFWGPLSEQFGRRPIFILTFFLYTCFQVGCALSPNSGAILVFRFLGGLFAAAPLTNCGAVLADIWDAKRRGKAMSIFTLGPFAGPAIGPTVAGYIAVSGTSWRWLFWVLTSFAGACLVIIIFTIPETYEPVILVRLAKQKRKETGNDKYYAPLERSLVGPMQRIEHVLIRPFKIMAMEPMLIAITLYMSFIYGCTYLLFEAFPIVFGVGHHMNTGATGLTFLPIPIGGAVGVAGYLYYWSPKYDKLVDEFAPHPVPPEYRLHMACYSATTYALSFFWFGWTSHPSISIWSPLFAAGLMGFGIQWLFMALFNYIIDAYLFVAASALASSTVVRSLFGAGFPLFANQMYEKLDPRWASTLVGCIALLMLPIPFVLIKYGPYLRLKSKYAPSKPPAPPADQEAAPPEESEESEKKSACNDS